MAKIAAAGMAGVMLAGTAMAQQAAPQAGSTSLAPPPNAPPPHNTPRGPYKTVIEAPSTLMSHTLYRPADLSPFTGSKRLPIIAWGNGACSNAGLLFSNFLEQFASHGYLAIASGPKDAPLPAFARARPGQSAVPAANANIPSAMTKDEDLIKAIDWAIAENGRQGSPLYGKLDPTKIAVMGQSCGGLQATWAAADPRVKAVVIWNSGVFNAPGTAPNGAPTRSLSGATKESLKKFHTPVAYFEGGPADAAYPNGKDDFGRVTVPAFFGSINSGHGGTYSDPGGGWFGEVGVKWLDWQLKGDRQAGTWFKGKDCVLCKNPIWETATRNGL